MADNVRDWLRNPTPENIEKIKAESERQQRVYAIDALKKIANGVDAPMDYAVMTLKHILGPNWRENVGP